MLYWTHVISTKEDLSRCPVFEVNHFLWTCRVRPQMFGQMAYLSGQGLYLHMTCMETNPKREQRNHRDRVCTDSAMEAFFAFPDPKLGQRDPPANDCLYLNLEINANGAMYAKYGWGRQGRQFITDEEYGLADVNAVIEKDRWSVKLLVPNLLLARVGGLTGFVPGSTFFCNFCKISEDPAIEHYAAYCPIPTPTPNFHLPQHFARAEITCFDRKGT